LITAVSVSTSDSISQPALARMSNVYKYHSVTDLTSFVENIISAARLSRNAVASMALSGGSASRDPDADRYLPGACLLPDRSRRRFGDGPDWVESPDAFVCPRINRLEMPGTEPEPLRPGEPTPITLSVMSAAPAWSRRRVGDGAVSVNAKLAAAGE